MKILIVCQFYYPERFTVSDIASELVVLGHDVSVITGKPNYSFGKILPEYKKIKFEIINGVKVNRVNLLPRTSKGYSLITNYLSFYFNAKRFVRHMKDDFDVVLSVSLSPVISIVPAIIYAKKHHVKHLLHCLDLWPESVVVTGAVRQDSLIYKLLYKWSKKIYLQCDKIIVSSPSFVNYFKETLKITDKPFSFIPQPSLSTDVHYQPVTFKNKHNFIYAGNVGHIQLVDQITQAALFIPKESDYQIHIIGAGSELENIKQIIDKNSLGNHVVCYGALSLSETQAFYNNADALIVSLKEGGSVGKTIPNKLVNYLKFGKPILGAINGDGKDVLLNSGGAILTSQTAEGIADGMMKIMQLSRKEKDDMGEKNRRYYQENFELHKVTQLLEKELLDAKKS